MQPGVGSPLPPPVPGGASLIEVASPRRHSPQSSTIDAPAPVGPEQAQASVAAALERLNGSRSSAVLPRPEDILASSGPDATLPSALSDRYEVVRTLGEGSFGTVDLVRDNDIARVVARKRLKPEWHQGETLARFVDEIKVVGQLEHPGIVPIHDVGLDDRGYFFVMKYVEGDTLEQLIDKLKAGDPLALARYPYEARAMLFLQVLEAVRFAHERSILHRDLKPENIIVGPYGEVIVMDWGLARQLRRAAPEAPAAEGGQGDKTVVDEAQAAAFLQGSAGNERLVSTRMGTVVGTPAYMSPEQARGRHDLVDMRSDLYSLAAVFYELMTLDHYLTPKSTPQHMLVGVMTEEPLAATAIHHRYAVPPEFTFFLRRGLEKDPAARFQSAAEMATALREILAGNIPVQCPCTGLKAAGNRWFDFIDDHPIGAITAAMLTSVCALYGAYGIGNLLIGLTR
jgi:serine/threonine protein kinase